MSEFIAFYNGKYLPRAECQLSLFDFGVMQGVIAGEMIRTFQHQPFHLSAHLTRLNYSLEQLGIESGYSTDELNQHVLQVIDYNREFIPAHHDLGLSIVVTPGMNPVYTSLENSGTSSATLIIYAFVLPMHAWAETLETGQSIVIPEIRQLPRNTIDPRIKTRSRLHWYLADKQARQQIPGSRALLLDDNDYITELSTANFFIVQQGVIKTPSVETTLGGVSQQFVIELAEELGILHESTDITREDVLNSDEAFSTSTPYCILPVSQVDGHQIGKTIPGPIVQQLTQAWSEQVGIDIVNQIKTMALENSH